MFQRSKKMLDARRLDLKTKKVAIVGDFLDDEEKKKLNVPEEKVPDIPQPEGERLTPVRPLPGGPKLRGEVEEEYTPMSAEEIAAKREEHEKGKPVPPTVPVEEGEEGEEVKTKVPPTFRNIMQDLLKEETPEGKKEQAQLAKYGPPETIKSIIDTLEPFQKQLAEVDAETAMAAVERSALPDILKDRARNLFESRSTGDLIKTEQLALNLIGARSRKEVQKAEEWLRDTENGQAYMDKAFDMYRTRRVMNMLSNTILAMEGQAVIDQPKGDPRQTAEQRAEKKRINGLVELLNDKRITDAEFEDAKRTGMTADEVVSKWAMPKKETIPEKVEREYREEEARRRKGEAVRLNMRKKAEGDTTGPGGDAWEYEWTSGPTPTKDEPQKRKHRFPFHNKPSGYTPGEGDQGNLHDIGPLGGQQDMNYLANVIKSMTKTADNDMFSTYSFDNNGKWLTYTLFKQAYSKFRPGDIVVQYGKTTADCQTYRRRFGSIKKAKISLVAALSPVLATVVSKPSPDDTLHDLQKGKGEPGGAYGPRTNPYDQQPWQGNRDGFDAKNTPRQRTQRKFIPHMDQADDEGSGFMGGRTMGNKKNLQHIFANSQLTPAGMDKLQELSYLSETQPDLYAVLHGVSQSNEITRDDIIYGRTDDVIDAWSTALTEGLIISDDLYDEDEEFRGELPGGMPEGIALSLKKTKKADFAAPVVETPEERAGTIEQPPVKPINVDQKRKHSPKKRWDTNEQQLTNSPNYMGEDSSGFDKERVRLSMKKLNLNMKKAAAPTYEALQAGLVKGQITQEEFDQMVEYYQLAPPTQAAPEVIIPENFVPQSVSEWDPNRGQTPQPQERGRLFFGKKK